MVDLETALVAGAMLPELTELRDSGLSRMELVGPLGIRLGLVVLNPQWLYVFNIGERTVYRFPAQELTRDTLRREALFQRLPVRVSPELFFLTFMSRVGVPGSGAGIACDFDEDEVAYRVRIPEGGRGGRIVWIEPHNYYPLRDLRYEGELPRLPELRESGGKGRPVAEVVYDKILGQGPASFPSQIRATLYPLGDKLSFTWRRAEAWPNFDVRVFEWEPPASLKIIDL